MASLSDLMKKNDKYVSKVKDHGSKPENTKEGLKELLNPHISLTENSSKVEVISEIKTTPTGVVLPNGERKFFKEKGLPLKNNEMIERGTSSNVELASKNHLANEDLDKSKSKYELNNVLSTDENRFLNLLEKKHKKTNEEYVAISRKEFVQIGKIHTGRFYTTRSGLVEKGFIEILEVSEKTKESNKCAKYKLLK